MMGRNAETYIGAAVLAAGAVLISLVFVSDRVVEEPGYMVQARFNRTDGLAPGAEVRLSGLTVGRVTEQQLDRSFRAIVSMHLDPRIELTQDTAAAIHSDGLLGSKYIELQPGASEETIPPGGEIRYTQDAVVLNELLELIVNEAKAKRGQTGEEGAQ